MLASILRPRRHSLTASSSYAACHSPPSQGAESALDTTIGGKRHPLETQVLADHSLHRSSQARRPAVQPNSTTTTALDTRSKQPHLSPRGHLLQANRHLQQLPPPPYPTTTKLPPPWRVSIPSLLLPFTLRLVPCCPPSPSPSIRVFIRLKHIANQLLLHRGGRRSRH